MPVGLGDVRLSSAVLASVRRIDRSLEQPHLLSELRGLAFNASASFYMESRVSALRAQPMMRPNSAKILPGLLRQS